jgi:hypothetical protein
MLDHHFDETDFVGTISVWNTVIDFWHQGYAEIKFYAKYNTQILNNEMSFKNLVLITDCGEISFEHDFNGSHSSGIAQS